VAALRHAWPEVLDRLRELRKTPWTFISQNATVLDVRDGVLTLAVATSGLKAQLAARDDFTSLLRQAVLEVVGADLRIESVVDGGAAGGGSSTSPSSVAGAGQRRPAPERPAPRQPPRHPVDDEPAPAPQDETGGADAGDAVIDDLSGEALLARELGASVIDVLEGPRPTKEVP
jgi:DNA polymerase-3 subunit gamma/tau